MLFSVLLRLGAWQVFKTLWKRLLRMLEGDWSLVVASCKIPSMGGWEGGLGMCKGSRCITLSQTVSEKKPKVYCCSKDWSPHVWPPHVLFHLNIKKEVESLILRLKLEEYCLKLLLPLNPVVKCKWTLGASWEAASKRNKLLYKKTKNPKLSGRRGHVDQQPYEATSLE